MNFDEWLHDTSWGNSVLTDMGMALGLNDDQRVRSIEWMRIAFEMGQIAEGGKPWMLSK